MNIQETHKTLKAGRWYELTLVEQMANIGTEVARALKWHAEGNKEYWEPSLYRALDLFDLTLADPRWRERLKEITRAREVVVDYFYGGNQYNSSAEWLDKYFLEFAYAARRGR